VSNPFLPFSSFPAQEVLSRVAGSLARAVLGRSPPLPFRSFRARKGEECFLRIFFFPCAAGLVGMVQLKDGNEFRRDWSFLFPSLSLFFFSFFFLDFFFAYGFRRLSGKVTEEKNPRRTFFPFFFLFFCLGAVFFPPSGNQ